MATHVEIAYPGSISSRHDEALERLATQHTGKWVASGVGILSGTLQRDIEFRFDAAAEGTTFVEACRQIPDIIILSVSEGD